jgi:outer membrane protein TolC
MALILSACAVGPKYERPATPVNADWSTKVATQGVTNAEPATEWWKQFNDPALDQLIEMAYHQNLSLQLAGLRIMESRAQLGIAVGRQYPQIQVVSASATATRLTDRAAQNLNVDPTFWDNQARMEMRSRWPMRRVLMRPGRRTSGADSAVTYRPMTPATLQPWPTTTTRSSR